VSRIHAATEFKLDASAFWNNWCEAKALGVKPTSSSSVTYLWIGKGQGPFRQAGLAGTLAPAVYAELLKQLATQGVECGTDRRAVLGTELDADCSSPESGNTTTSRVSRVKLLLVRIRHVA